MISRLITLCLLVFSLTACTHYGLVGGLREGQKAPSLKTKTLADVGGDLSKITTYRQPDPRMYKYSLDQALKMHKPIVLEFATPGHCTVCDGQLQILKALLNQYNGKVLFLHMDEYMNPEAYIAFGVKGDPWTFVIDDQGMVRYQMAGSMLYQELDMQIQKVLKEDKALDAQAAAKANAKADAKDVKDKKSVTS